MYINLTKGVEESPDELNRRNLRYYERQRPELERITNLIQIGVSNAESPEDIAKAIMHWGQPIFSACVTYPVSKIKKHGYR
jgi:hypothetical protein